MSSRKMAATTVAIGVFLALVTFVAGELDRFYSGDRGFWRVEIVLIAYAGLWVPCATLLGMWQGRRIFGTASRYFEYNRAVKTSGLPPDIDLGVLRRLIRFGGRTNLLELLQGLVNTSIAATLAFGSPFHHWLTATWFALGAFSAFTDARRTRRLTKGLVTQLKVRIREPD